MPISIIYNIIRMLTSFQLAFASRVAAEGHAMRLPKLMTYLAFFHAINALRSYTMEFLAFEQKYSPRYLEVISYKLTNISGRVVLNGSGIYNRDIEAADVVLRMTVLESKRGVKWQWLNVKLDLCKLVDGNRKQTVNMVYYIVKNFKSYGNLIPDKCPIKKGKDYNLKNLYLNAENFPPYMPEMKMIFFIQLQHKKFPFYEANATIVIAAKGKKL